MPRGEGRSHYSARRPSHVLLLVGIDITNSVSSAPLDPKESIVNLLFCYSMPDVKKLLMSGVFVGEISHCPEQVEAWISPKWRPLTCRTSKGPRPFLYLDIEQRRSSPALQVKALRFSPRRGEDVSN